MAQRKTFTQSQMLGWGIEEFRAYIDEGYRTGYLGPVLDDSLTHLFDRIDRLNTLHTYRACTACGNGVRHSYSVFLSPEEVLCYDCAAKEIKGLRAQIARLSDPDPRTLNLTGATIMTRLTTGETGEDGIAPA